MHVLTNAEKLIPRRDAASLAESRKLAGIRIVTGTTSPFTRYERISVSPASCSIRSEYVIAFYTFKLQYKCNNSTPAWEQRKFGDCFEFLKSNTLSRAGLNGENGTARNVHYGDILIKFGDCLDGERSDLPFITDDTVLPKYAGSILREGDVIFADTAEDETAGKCVELRKLPKEPTISGLHTIPARPRFPFGTGYLGHYLNSDAYHRQLLPLMQGIKVISVSKAALQDTQVRFPGLSEQSAIGAALNEIDSLITLHQRKYDKLVIFKKSMLEKMFPKDGESVPEIRFAGFTDPWEQRKFSNLTDRVSMQSSDPDLPQVEYEDIVSGEGTLNKDLRDKEGGKTGIKFYAGDVLYGKLRPYLMNWLYPQFNGVAVGDFWVLRATECDSSFLYRLVQTDSFQRLANVSSGSKMPRADWNLISQSFFAVPADYAEQRVIAKSLAELDDLITLHQRKRLWFAK